MKDTWSHVEAEISWLWVTCHGGSVGVVAVVRQLEGTASFEAILKTINGGGLGLEY